MTFLCFLRTSSFHMKNKCIISIFYHTVDCPSGIGQIVNIFKSNSQTFLSLAPVIAYGNVNNQAKPGNQNRGRTVLNLPKPTPLFNPLLTLIYLLMHGFEGTMLLEACTMYFPKQHYESIVPEKSGINRFSASLFLQILHYDINLPSMQCAWRHT